MKILKKNNFGRPDPENPEWTKADFARAYRLKDNPALQKTIRKSVRGRPAGTGKKEAVTISLDKDVVAKLRASGAGWQTRLNDMLRTTMGLWV